MENPDGPGIVNCNRNSGHTGYPWHQQIGLKGKYCISLISGYMECQKSPVTAWSGWIGMLSVRSQEVRLDGIPISSWLKDGHVTFTPKNNKDQALTFLLNQPFFFFF